MKLNGLLISALFVFALALGGCGGSDDSEPVETTDGDTAEQSDTTDTSDQADTSETADTTDTAEQESVGAPSCGSPDIFDLDCSIKTPSCHLWYCNAKKTVDHLYDCETSGVYSTDECTTLKGCADAYKACITPYCSQCNGESIPMGLITTCTSQLSACERPVISR